MGRRIGGPGGGSDPGPEKKPEKKAAGSALAGVTLALALAAGSGGIGAGGGATIAENAAGRSLSAREAEGKDAARKGQADRAWRRLGLRTLKKAVKQEFTCVRNSTGQVREFLVRNPCSSLYRILFAVGEGGNSAVISVVWIGFRSSGQARQFEDVEQIQGSGDITPLAGSLLGLADVRFSGRHYRSRRRGRTVVIAETETLTGTIDDATLNTAADVAVYLPRP